ncbi:unnamed protein product, partial [Nesidiocoris tenuis]
TITTSFSHPKQHHSGGKMDFVFHRSFPVLPAQHAALAELAPPQFVFQRLLRQDSQAARPARQRRLLDSPSGGTRHVRERIAPQAAEAVQIAQIRQGPPRKRTGRPRQPQQDHFLDKCLTETLSVYPSVHSCYLRRAARKRRHLSLPLSRRRRGPSTSRPSWR